MVNGHHDHDRDCDGSSVVTEEDDFVRQSPKIVERTSCFKQKLIGKKLIGMVESRQGVMVRAGVCECRRELVKGAVTVPALYLQFENTKNETKIENGGWRRALGEIGSLVDPAPEMKLLAACVVAGG